MLFDSLRQQLTTIVTGKIWTFSIATIILINTIVLGMETYPDLMLEYGEQLIFIDQTILYIFVCELMVRFFAYGFKFFRQPWSLFDFFVVAIAFLPSQNAFGALRAVRALRVLRLVSIFPKLRGVIEGLVLAIPGIISIVGVMAIILCVFGLIASKLYGYLYPEWFGNLHLSIFSLFQIMTLEGWPDIVRTVMKEMPYAWLFFVTYILIATFSVLNLFIAVIVDAMQRNNSEEEDTHQKQMDAINIKLDLLLSKINSLSK